MPEVQSLIGRVSVEGVAESERDLARFGDLFDKAGDRINTTGRAAAAVFDDFNVNPTLNDLARLDKVGSTAFEHIAEAAAETNPKIDGLSRAIGLQERELTILRQELTQVSEKYGASSTQAQRKQIAIEKLSASLQESQSELRQESQALATAGKAMDDASGKASRFEQVTTGAFRHIGAVAVNLGADIARGAAQSVASVVNISGDYEATLNRFSSVAGDSLTDAGLKVSDFGDLALDMGAQTAFSAGQAGDAMVELVKGGVDPLTQRAGGLKASLSLAAAGELELATAAEIGAKQLGVWTSASANASEKAAFLTRTADLLAQAANASTVGVEDLALGLANSGLAAKTAGVAYDETVQTMALIAPGFSSAADAGTSYKTFLQNMIPTTERQVEAMIDLNLATADGKSKFYDAAGSFIGMEAAATLLYESTKDLSEEQKSLALNTIFGSDALRAAAILAERGGEGYRKMGEDMAVAGTAAEQAAKRNQGFNFALESLGGSLETLGIVVGTAALPKLAALINDVFIPGVNAATDFARAVTESNDPLGVMSDRLNTAVPGAGTLFGLVRSEGVPALEAVTVATIAYGAASLATATKSLPALSTSISAVTTRAGALTAALGPYAVLAGAVYLAASANQEWEETTRAAISEQERYNETIQGAVTAHERLQAIQSDGDTDPYWAEQIRTASDEIVRLREEHDELTLALERAKTGFRNGGTYADLTADIQENEAAMREATAAAGELAQAQQVAAERAEFQFPLQNWRAMETASYNVATAVTTVNQALALSEEEIEKFNDVLAKVVEGGPEALAAVSRSEVDFWSERESLAQTHEDRVTDIIRSAGGPKAAAASEAAQEQLAAEQASYDASLEQQTVAYAMQQAAQRQHLGQMLIDYTESYGALNGIASERISAMTEAIATEYGVQESQSERSFSAMIGHINAWAADSSVSTGSVIGDLQFAEETAENTTAAMDALAKDYTANLIQNFKEGKIDADELTRGLSQIPSIITSRVENNFAEAAGAARDVSLAVRSVPEVKMVRIQAQIDGDLKRRSPAPIEQVMANIEKFAARAHTFRVDTTGMDQLKETLSIMSQLGGASESLTKVNDFQAPSDTSLRSFFASANDTAQLAKGYSLGWTKEIAEATNRYLDSATKATSVIGSGVDALSKLPEYAGVSRDQVLRFGNDLHGTVMTLAEIVKNYDQEALASAAVYASTADGVLKLVGTGVDALSRLPDYGGVTRAQVLRFGNDVHGTVSTLAIIVKDFDRDGLATAADWSASAGKVLSGVGDGVDALTAIAKYKGVSRDAVLLFGHDVYSTVETLQVIVRDFDRDGMDAAREYSASAGDVIGLVGDGVDELAGISKYEGVTQAQIYLFARDQKEVVWALESVARDFDADGTEAAGDWASSAGKVVGIVGDGVDGLKGIAKYRGVPQAQIYLFARDMKEVTWALQSVAKDFDQDGTESAASWAKSVDVVISPIEKGVNSFKALETLGPIPAEKINALVAGMALATRMMGQAASTIDEDMTDEAVRFADASGRVLDPIDSAVSTFESLKDYEGVAPGAVRLVTNDMLLAVAMMTDATATLDSDGVEAAAEYAELAGTIFDAVSSGVDLLVKIGDYEGVAPEQFARLSSDMDTVYAVTRSMKERADITARDAILFKGFMEDATGHIRDAFEAISDLDGLSVHAEVRGSIHGSVSTSTDADTANDGGGDPPGWLKPLGDGGGRANGGPIYPGNAYTVGENGPEKIVPLMPQYVIPNEQAFGGGGSVTVYVTNHNAPGTDVRGVERATRSGIRDGLRAAGIHPS